MISFEPRGRLIRFFFFFLFFLKFLGLGTAQSEGDLYGKYGPFPFFPCFVVVKSFEHQGSGEAQSGWTYCGCCCCCQCCCNIPWSTRSIVDDPKTPMLARTTSFFVHPYSSHRSDPSISSPSGSCMGDTQQSSCEGLGLVRASGQTELGNPRRYFVAFVLCFCL